MEGCLQAAGRPSCGWVTWCTPVPRVPLVNFSQEASEPRASHHFPSELAVSAFGGPLEAKSPSL